MPILDLQRSMRRLGRIRMGSKTASNDGGTHPKKLEQWRMTSPSSDLLDKAAEMYGGTVTKWEGSPSGVQFELFTEARSLEVIIPPGEMAFSQHYEMWAAGGCLRRCDGVTEQMSGDPCLCPADRDERLQLAGNGRACKPTTRLFVIQPRLPDIGLWHVESHGFYAAVELAGSIEVLRSAAATSGLIPARLTIDQRTVKRDGKTRNFAVPVIELPTLTAHTLMTGEVAAPELGQPDRPALPEPEPAVVEAPKAKPAAAKPAPKPKAKPTTDAPPVAEDGGALFRRAITAAAKRMSLDAAQLDQLAVATVGKKVAEITSPDDANKLIAAIPKGGAK